jgi:hypothetical protein
MEMLFLGAVCVGLAIYILYLQNKVEDAESMMTNMIDAMIDIADGKAKAVRTGDTGVKVVSIEVKKEMLLS